MSQVQQFTPVKVFGVSGFPGSNYMSTRLNTNDPASPFEIIVEPLVSRAGGLELIIRVKHMGGYFLSPLLHAVWLPVEIEEHINRG